MGAGAESSALEGTTSVSPGPVWPCGGCRQKIFEFASEGCEVVALSPEGEVGRQTIEQLLPLGFRLDPAQVRRA